MVNSPNCIHLISGPILFCPGIGRTKKTELPRLQSSFPSVELFDDFRLWVASPLEKCYKFSFLLKTKKT